MNIQKSRIAALLTMILTVCVMVTLFALPVSAATIEVPYDMGKGIPAISAAFVYEQAKADLQGYPSYFDLACGLGISTKTYQYAFASDGSGAFLDPQAVDTIVRKYNTAYPESPIVKPEFPTYYDSTGYVLVYLQCPSMIDSITKPGQGILYRDVPDPEPYVSAFSFLTESDLWHLMDDIKGILPAVMQVLVGYIAIRKGIAFLQWCMNKA